MKYSELNLSRKNEIKTIKIGEAEIQVLQYLPIEDKIDLIDIALQNAKENGIYDEMKLDMYFNLYLVFMYTNLEFSDEERADLTKLYDELESNGIFLDIIEAMDQDEYNNLIDYLEIMKENNQVYMTSAAALLQSFIQDLPQNAATAAEIVDNFDKEKYKEVVEFAQSANGGRPI